MATKNMLLMKAFVLIPAFLGMTAYAFDFDPFVIYGDDDRKDLYEVRALAKSDHPHAQMWLERADATVMLVDTKDIQVNTESGIAQIAAIPFKVDKGLCDNERFGDQLVSGFCSGSLVGPDLVLTAGHCVTSEANCLKTSFVFGYGLQSSEDLDYVNRPVEEVYGCSKIIKRMQTDRGSDIALIKLDRRVPNHTPFPVRRKGKISLNAKLALIGYPSGLPVKFAANAVVRKNQSSTFFVASTDSYGGNSGSPVIDQNTGILEGVLVRGEEDFVMRGGCWVSNKCSERSCRGEDVVRVSEILPYLH